jgi:hypothetical protein
MIDVVHTCCKSCEFAQYSGITQTGCALDYIQKFADNSVEILEAYDDDLEFYVINNKRCLGYRESTWFKSVGMENATIEEKKQYVIENNHINYLLVIYLKNMVNDLSILEDRIVSLKYKPKKIILVRYATDIEDFSFQVLNDFLKRTKLDQISWRIQTMENEDDTFENVLHNILSLNKKHRFVLYIKYDETSIYPINDIVNKGNDIAYEKIGKFDIISNSNKSCALFSAPSYRFALMSLKKDMFQEELCYTYI